MNQESQRNIKQFVDTLQGQSTQTQDRVRQVELSQPSRQILAFYNQMPDHKNSITGAYVGGPVILPAKLLGLTGQMTITMQGRVANWIGAAANLTFLCVLGAAPNQITMGTISIPTLTGAYNLINVVVTLIAKNAYNKQRMIGEVRLTRTADIWNNTNVVEGYTWADLTADLTADTNLYLWSQWGTANPYLFLQPEYIIFSYPSQSVLG